jgi:hypothetical protein
MFVMSLLQFAISCIRVLSLTSAGQNLTNAMKRAKSKLHLWQRFNLNHLDSETNQSISILAQEFEDHSVIQPCNCFVLGYSSQLSGFSVLLTFAVVLFQFRSSETPNSFILEEKV